MQDPMGNAIRPAIPPRTGDGSSLDRQHVHILMATHNGHEHIREQIASIRQQSHENWDLYISDDHSTDSTAEIALSAARCDRRVHLLMPPAVGGSAQANFLSALRALPRGSVMLSDQDDVWFRDKVKLSLRALMDTAGADNRPCLIHTDSQLVDKDLHPLHPSQKRFSALLDPSPCLQRALVENSVTGNTTLLSPSLADMARKTEPTTPMIMHDWWIYLLAASLGEVVYIDTPTLAYRQHANNAVGAKQGAETLTPDRLAQAIRRAAQTVAQARSFLRVYSNLLPEASRDLVSIYSDITSLPWRIRNPRLKREHVVKSRWKARAVHRIAIAMLTEKQVRGALPC